MRPGNKRRQCRNEHEDDGTEDRTRCKIQGQMNRATHKRKYQGLKPAVEASSGFNAGHKFLG